MLPAMQIAVSRSLMILELRGEKILEILSTG
jgi:hypothetical protein